MKRPTKKKSAPKKAAKKPAARRQTPSAKTGAKAGPVKSPGRASPPANGETYAPKPIQGVGWPAFRYPLQ